MRDYKRWEHTDADFTLEELAEAVASRLRWDEQVEQWQKEGRFGDDHKPFDPLATEDLGEES